MTRPRISGGSARGRPLAQAVPAGVRPSSSRVREALFSMVGHDLTGQTVLDAFAGSGLLGLEAWSRGAEVTLVERDRRALQGIRANAQALDAVVRIVGGDVIALARTLGRFDGVLVDPPYALPPAPILDALAPAVGGWLMLESDAAVEAPAPPPGLELDRRRVYGQTALTLYVRASPGRPGASGGGAH